jgi:hypothetical protein
MKDLTMYGVSQNPSTNDFILIFKAGYHCEICGKKYTDIYQKWCKPCQLSDSVKNVTNWSNNEKIDNLIKEMRSKIDFKSIIFEWIPYEFKSIKKLGKDNPAKKLYSAIWKDGPLTYDNFKMEWTRSSAVTRVALKYLCNQQNITQECLDEVIISSF